MAIATTSYTITGLRAKAGTILVPGINIGDIIVGVSGWAGGSLDNTNDSVFKRVVTVAGQVQQTNTVDDLSTGVTIVVMSPSTPAATASSPTFSGTVTAPAIAISGQLTDGLGSVGVPGQVLSSTAAGTKWANAGGAASANTVQAIVDFGIAVPQETVAQAPVVAAWVTASSVLICSVVEGQDHTADEISVEGVTATVGAIQPGIGFTVSMSAPNGASGKFLVNIAGF